MCGIAGILDPAASTGADRLGALASTMASSLVHRGPDDSGLWVDADAGVALGHQRLAVIDLGPGGRSPWSCRVAGGWWPTTGRSTTMSKSGVDWSASGPGSAAAPIRRCWWRPSNGGASTARWTPARVCSPSPCGTGRSATFTWCVTASVRSRSTSAGLANVRLRVELKAVCTLPGFAPELDRQAVARYLRHNCIPAPDTIYRGIRKLLPATW